MKYHSIIASLLILCVGGCKFLTRPAIAQETLSGEIRLTLKRGLWTLQEEKRLDRDITLDITCDRAHCDPQIWGYAPTYNQADHQGTVEVVSFDAPKGLLRLRINLTISPDPWMRTTGTANYEINLKIAQNQLSGVYSGTFNNQPVKGEVSGTKQPAWPQQLPNHLLIRPQEHPRLIFRQQELPALREKAKTPIGKAILAQLSKRLAEKIYYDGFVPTGGYHAAGYCFLAVLNEEQKPAETAWQIIVNSMNQPSPRLLEQSPIVAGVALAYDLCYNAWNEERKKQVTRWLGQQTALLIEGTPDRGWNPQPQSNWNARARGAAGLAALAILGEPKEFLGESIEPQRLLKIAERNVKRFLTIGIGEHGFGGEGDHYTTEPLILTIFPFLQAHKNVLGKDWVTGSRVEWFLPHYVTRLVGRGGQVSMPTYGRHRLPPGGSLFAVGFDTLPERFLPGVMWFFNGHYGWEGDRSFGIRFPHEAAFILAGYRENIATQNPAEIWNRVLVDEQKGFYTFRNQWQDENDFVASIYLQREPLNQAWWFPDAGSFRIWGLGGRWASPGPSQPQRENENVVVGEESHWRGAQPIFFQAQSNGSGVVTLSQENWLRSLAVDYSRTSGAPGLFVLIDKFTGAAASNTQTWLMHTEETVKINGQRFTIQAASGATMQGIFVTPNAQITFEPKEKGGVLRATGRDFFVIMTVQKGTAPHVEIEGIGLDSLVKVGGQTIKFRDNRVILN